jgi:hypothetical protein
MHKRPGAATPSPLIDEAGHTAPVILSVPLSAVKAEGQVLPVIQTYDWSFNENQD